MATIAQLEAAKQSLLAQLAEIRSQRFEILRKVDDGSLTEEEARAAVIENNLLRREVEAKVAELDREIEQAAPSTPGESEYVRRDGTSGLYVYVNAATGQQFLSPTPPTAAQQASFAQRNPGADEFGNPLPTPEPASVDSAGAIAGQGSQAADENARTQNPPVPEQTVNTDGTAAVGTSTATPTNAEPVAGSDQDVPKVLPPPPKLPAAADTDAGADAAGNQIDGTPGSNSNISGARTTPIQSTRDLSVGTQSSATQSYIYQLTGVVSKFSAGKFTQAVHGAIVIFNAPPSASGTSGNPGTSNSTQTVDNPDAGRAAAAVEAIRARQAFALTDPRRVDTTPAPVVTTDTTPESQPVEAVPIGPAESAPPTSGDQPVAVEAAPTPPATVSFAGATLQASLQISGRVFISLTLPSGRSEINVDGWGDEQWDSLITSVGGLTDTRDIAAANSLKASWPTLQAQLRASVKSPTVVTAAPQNLAKDA